MTSQLLRRLRRGCQDEKNVLQGDCTIISDATTGKNAQVWSYLWQAVMQDSVVSACRVSLQQHFVQSFPSDQKSRLPPSAHPLLVSLLSSIQSLKVWGRINRMQASEVSSHTVLDKTSQLHLLARGYMCFTPACIPGADKLQQSDVYGSKSLARTITENKIQMSSPFEEDPLAPGLRKRRIKEKVI